MMLRPGSHLLIAEERARDPEWRAASAKVAPTPLEKLPDLPYSDPIPLLARAGQVSACSTVSEGMVISLQSTIQ